MAQAGWITGSVAGSIGFIYMLFWVAIFVLPLVGLMFATSASPTPAP